MKKIKLKNEKCKVGKQIKVWWSTGKPNNMADILEILPYSGLYSKWYDCVLKLSAPNTYNGSVEMAYNSEDFAYDSRQQ